ncbi:hypothetical protein M885DRAFT_449459 [Pelagophyceae sp. CCMP2097]|nr:hypothetical protein M885DRAFT_449459 [Pelagophyceae sp. CCMP2097]
MPNRRVALVTGANKGVGLEIAKGLAQNGFTTVLGCRDVGLGEAAAAKLRSQGVDNVSVERLDLTDAATWATCVDAIEAKHGRLDVLCNNAAICFNDATLYGKVSYTPFERQAEVTVRTNFGGTLGITKACLPLLRKAPSPRVINIASSAGRLSILKSKAKAALVTSPQLQLGALEGLMKSFVDDVKAGKHVQEGWPNTCYGTSKIGIIAMTRVFARDEPLIAFNAVDPGYCKTDQNANNGSLPPTTGAKTPVALATCEAPQSGKFFSYNGNELDWLRT